MLSSSTSQIFETVQLEDYRYSLPEERIAKHPLPERDKSKLLLYKQSNIEHRHFYELPDLLPQHSLLVFNNTKVIPARLQFKKDTGALIEIFLLQPVAPSADIQTAMSATGFSIWQCMIGNRKRWRPEQTLQLLLNVRGQEVQLEAKQGPESSEVTFHWNSDDIHFAELIEAAGEIPLPPYLNRKAEKEDKDRYQTVYSSQNGAVAAPTAGLHFTPAVLERLKEKGIQTEELTLHVGAGTFQPIKENNLALHPMHREQVVISESNVRQLLNHKGPLISVGTTSMRSLESLYWYGVKLIHDPAAPFFITKEESYQYEEEQLPTREEALKAVLKKVEQSATSDEAELAAFAECEPPH